MSPFQCILGGGHCLILSTSKANRYGKFYRCNNCCNVAFGRDFSGFKES